VDVGPADLCRWARAGLYLCLREQVLAGHGVPLPAERAEIWAEAAAYRALVEGGWDEAYGQLALAAARALVAAVAAGTVAADVADPLLQRLDRGVAAREHGEVRAAATYAYRAIAPQEGAAWWRAGPAPMPIPAWQLRNDKEFSAGKRKPDVSDGSVPDQAVRMTRGRGKKT
jgi:hypothetical protein